MFPPVVATCAPATEPIKVWKVSLDDGKVCIDPSEHGPDN